MAWGFEMSRPTHSDILPPASIPPSLTYPNNTTNWGPNIQPYELMRDIIKQTTTLWLVEFREAQPMIVAENWLYFEFYDFVRKKPNRFLDLALAGSLWKLEGITLVCIKRKSGENIRSLNFLGPILELRLQFSGNPKMHLARQSQGAQRDQPACLQQP